MLKVDSKHKRKYIKLFSVFLLSSFLFVSCSTPSSAVPELSDTSATEADITDSDKNTFSLSKAIFVGDSNIAHLASYGILTESQIWTGSESYMTLEVDVYRKYIVYPKTKTQMTVANAAALENAEFMIITLGTDGAMSLDKEGFRMSYTQLIDSIRKSAPKTEIFLQAIFPVRMGTVGVRFHDVERANHKFILANKWLKEIADEYGLLFIDSYSILSDDTGVLMEKYNTDHLDGYHLNRAGLYAMLDYIKFCASLKYGAEE